MLFHNEKIARRSRRMKNFRQCRVAVTNVVVVGILFFLCMAIGVVKSDNNKDLFNYDYPNDSVSGGGGTDYGQPSWGDVSCEDLDQCAGWPDKFLHSKGFTVAGDNKCRWCLDGGPEDCGLHRQSPINLIRDKKDHECIDWHYVKHEAGSCDWNDLKDNFEIMRHRLRINIPQLDNGDVDCENNGKRYYPRIDYSKGFPNWWWLDHVEISVPSNHVQEGKRYDAEVNLAHFYEVKHEKNQLGYLSIFLEQYPDAESWLFLDKLICQWRIEEEKVRSACGLEPAPPYGRCQLFRGQAPSKEWLEEAGLMTNRPTRTPRTPPPRGGGGGGGINSRPPTDAFNNMGHHGGGDEPSHVPSVAPSPTEVPNTLAPTFVPTTWDDAWDDPTVAPTAAWDPTASPTAWDPTASPTAWDPTASPTVWDPTASPTVWDDTWDDPTAAPTDLAIDDNSMGIMGGGGGAVPASAPVVADIDCPSYNVNYDLMCDDVDTGCCNSLRSDTDFCWDVYENIFPGDQIYSACNKCCPGGPKTVGPPHPEKSGLPQTIKCSSVNQPFRICRSCCDHSRNLRIIGSSPNYCQDDVLPQYGDVMEEICYYCCSASLTYADGNRNLQSNYSSISSDILNEKSQLLQESSSESKNSPSSSPADEAVPEGGKVIYAAGRRYLLRKENFEVSEESHEEWFGRIYTDFKHREAQQNQAVVHEIDYEDIPYSDYEWLTKVNTEYYFRYEGTMLVPPCWEIIHWRVYKDPIRVHKRQIKELNRLLAWRRSPSGDNHCQPDTAGRLTSSGDRVKVFRDLQYYHLQHRMTFCECKDWPSKFQADRDWCNGWRTEHEDVRYYWRPYNFDTNGEY